MGNCIGGPKVEPQSIIMAGLDASGRTTLLFRMAAKSLVAQPLPTIGFNLETVIRNDVPLRLWDVGGGSAVRSMWKHYLPASAALYAVDRSDSERLKESCEVLYETLIPNLGRGTPLLLVITKMDLPGLSVAEVVDAFQMSTQQRPWYALGVNSIAGDGVEKALLWLSSATLGFSDGRFHPDDHGVIPPWTPVFHKQYPSEFKQIVMTLLCMSLKDAQGRPKYPHCLFGSLPGDAVLRIIAQLARVMYFGPSSRQSVSVSAASEFDFVPEDERQKISLLRAVDR